MEKPTKRIQRQMMDWKKIFSNHVSDKGLASKVYKELLKHMSQTKNKNNSAIKGEIKTETLH